MLGYLSPDTPEFWLPSSGGLAYVNVFPIGTTVEKS